MSEIGGFFKNETRVYFKIYDEYVYKNGEDTYYYLDFVIRHVGASFSIEAWSVYNSEGVRIADYYEHTYNEIAGVYRGLFEIEHYINMLNYATRAVIKKRGQS